MYNVNSLFLPSGGYDISKSLRFNVNDSAHLTRTPSSASNRRTFTWSAWIKTNRVDSHETLFSATPSGDGTLQYDIILTNGQLNTYGLNSGFVWDKKLSRVFRDPSAWYHLVVAFDTTDSTAEDRIKIYVNGERQTDFATNTNPSANVTTGFNNTAEHSIGGRTGYSGGQYFDGYQTEINFIDGLQLGPESFGETDPVTGAWVPKGYSGSHGTNGFYLNFSDNSNTTATTLGKDYSGNSNNWTPNNFQVSTPGGTDSMEDTPTNNWCTLNYAANSNGTRTLSDGNLQADLSTSGAKAVGTFLIPLSGKWYWEMMANDSNGNQDTGVLQADSNFNTRDTSLAASYFPNGEYKIESASQTSGFSSYTAQDIISIAVDADASPPEIYFAKNGTWQNSADPAAGTNGLALTAGKRYLPYLQHGSSSSSTSGLFNFGQRAFSYTPPTGFKTLNSENTPSPIIADGTKHFNTVLYTGNGSSQAVTGVGFQPDWVWGKPRTVAHFNTLQDSVRGAGFSLYTNSSAVEEANANMIQSFNSDGFTVGSTGNALNNNGENYVAWNWKLNGGTNVTNTDGVVTSSLQANVNAGVSLVLYTGTGSATSVGHGLGVTPNMIWVKNRDAAEGWIIDSSLVTGNSNGTLHFNTDAEYTGGSNQFGSHTSTTFGIKDAGNINTSGNDYIAYCFSNVEGYSKVGTFTGTASSGDGGPFVTLNFKPTWVLIKSTTVATSWYLFDDTRESIQTQGSDAQVLFPDTAAVEDANGGQGIDFLSNGFKVRAANGYGLNNSATYLFMAFAERPFKYANAR